MSLNASSGSGGVAEASSVGIGIGGAARRSTGQGAGALPPNIGGYGGIGRGVGGDRSSTLTSEAASGLKKSW
eukprot:2258689-Pleurochrysis_carterae.AAC.1